MLNDVSNFNIWWYHMISMISWFYMVFLHASGILHINVCTSSGSTIKGRGSRACRTSRCQMAQSWGKTRLGLLTLIDRSSFSSDSCKKKTKKTSILTFSPGKWKKGIFWCLNSLNCLGSKLERQREFPFGCFRPSVIHGDATVLETQCSKKWVVDSFTTYCRELWVLCFWWMLGGDTSFIVF